MKASTLKPQKRQETRNEYWLQIQTNGKYNDYPQRVIEIVDASGTGSSCVRTYSSFIQGRGFNIKEFFQAVVNRKGQTPDYLLQQVSDDYAKQGGFALHVNYNALYQIIEVQHIPFENVRFKNLDVDYHFNKIAIHEDWGRRNIRLKPFRTSDIDFIDFYDPNALVIQAQVDEAGGWGNYKGQIFYYSNRGDKVYPLPIFDAELTDMSTEEGLSNIKLRNARNNFLPAGLLVDYDNSDQSEDQENKTKKELTSFQGDTETGKLMYIQCKNPTEKPEFIPLKMNSYDKDFTETEKSSKDNIGRVFSQPPILRAEDVGSNFGSELMKNAYAFYNSITGKERMILEESFKNIFSKWHNPMINQDQDYTILPKKYDVEETMAERLGGVGLKEVLVILSDATMTPQKKQNILKVVFEIDDDSINLLLPEQNVNNN